jgi:hypothetical protein
LTTFPKKTSSSRQDWQTLAEFVINDKVGGEGKYAQIFIVLEEAGLNLQQVKHIQGKLEEILQNVEEAHIPVNLRISLKGGGLADHTGDINENIQIVQASEIGLGFFIVQRFIQRIEGETNPGGQIALEVLIYSEH